MHAEKSSFQTQALGAKARFEAGIEIRHKGRLSLHFIGIRPHYPVSSVSFQ